LFYYEHRLYQTQRTILASNPNSFSGEAIRFQQSRRFTNNASWLFNSEIARLLGLGSVRMSGLWVANSLAFLLPWH
jgi:hypothetical protein